jgi:hypothetical protein
MRRTDRTFIRYIASAFGTHQHEHFDSSILPANEPRKQHQHQDA